MNWVIFGRFKAGGEGLSNPQLAFGTNADEIGDARDNGAIRWANGQSRQ